jgi:hypothetical protein
MVDDTDVRLSVKTQIMSTEDVQDLRCAAFNAAMDMLQELIAADMAAGERAPSVRLVLPHGQVGAIMGKGGSSIKCDCCVTVGFVLHCLL